MGLKLDKARDMVNKFPNSGKSSLAEILFKDNSALFKDKEEARLYIRRATGAQGNKMRKKIKQLAPQSIGISGISYNPYSLPAEDHNDIAPYKIKPTEQTVIGLLSDIHFPFQHNEALTVALDYCKKEKVTHLIFNGDLIDSYEISSFMRDPAKRSFAQEVRIVRSFLETVCEKFKGVKIIFKEGNHDKRFMLFLRRKAPELLGFETFNLKSLLGLNTVSLLKNDRDEHLPALPIDHVIDSKLIEVGNLIIIHGHEFGQQIFSPVNPARGFFLRGKTNVIGGHHHQVSSHSENRLDGKQIVSYSTGHLADPTPEYKTINNWSHGFAIIHHIKDGNNINFQVRNMKIINGQVY